jgi:adenylate cyclase
MGKSVAHLTIKSKSRDNGVWRQEFEYVIPVADAFELINICQGGVVEKTRYLCAGGDGHTWEVDVFEGSHAGLVMAEIEMASIDEKIVIPAWMGSEVTDDPAYNNLSLATYGLPW